MKKKLIAIYICVILILVSIAFPVSGDPPYQPSNPYPPNGLIGLPIDTNLSWYCDDPDGDPVTYDVYFGTTSPPPIVINNQSAYTYSPGTLNLSTTYYWRIVAWDNHSLFNASPIWNFTTNSPPYQPSNPNPANNSVDESIMDARLNWTGGDPDPYDNIRYSIFFGNNTDPPPVDLSHPFTEYILGRLEYDTQYYWKIISCDAQGYYTSGPVWTFHTEVDIPPDIPSNPDPANESTDVGLYVYLNWISGDPNPGDIVSYDVYFGTTNPPPMVRNNQSVDTYDPGTLNPSTTYYWKIRAWDDYGYSATGPTWVFYTRANTPPDIPSNPSPANNSMNVLIDADLSWTGGDPDLYDTVTYDVFFGTDPDPPQVSSNQSNTDYNPGELDYNTQYYWRIEAEDNFGNSTNGPVWTFRTEVYENDPPDRPDAPDGPSSGKYLNSHTFTTSTIDPDGDEIFYRFDWDDGTNSKWLGPYKSGRLVAASHTWLVQGSYAIRVQARDEHFALSEWSDPYSVNMPTNKLVSRHPLFLLLFNFLEKHPHISPILRLILGL